MVGELQGGELLLKSAWRSGMSGWEDDVNWKAVWPLEAEWQEGLSYFREAHAVSDGLAKKVFLPRRADRTEGLAVRMIRVPRGKPRLAGLLIRGIIFSTLLVGLAALFLDAIDEEKWLLLILHGSFASWIVWLAFVFVRKEARSIFSGYRRFHKGYKRVCDETTKFVPVSRAEADKLLGHPWGRKYPSELEAAGCTHVGDIRSEPAVSEGGLTRVFLTPDGMTYLNVLFVTSTNRNAASGFLLWPASVLFLAYTYFPNGGRVSSLNGLHSGYRRKRSGKEQIVRLFPGLGDPVELLQRHAAAVEEHSQVIGLSPLRLLGFEAYLRRLSDDHEEHRRMYADCPYTWGDHIRWYLQMPRREYTK
jgi:hypothetical protein